MLHNIKNIFHLIIIFQCVFFSIYLLTHKPKKRLSNLILGGFLLSMAISEIGGVLSHFIELSNLAFANFPHAFFIKYPFFFAYVPFLFFYILSFTRKDFKFKKVYLWHFLPFLLFVFLIFFRSITQDADILRELLRAGSPFSFIETRIINFLGYLQFFCYAVASLVILKNYRTRIQNAFSNIKSINLAWLNFVVFGFIGWKSLRFINYLLWILTQSPNAKYLYIGAEIVFLIFLSLMFLKGLRQPVILAGYEEGNQNERKYEKTTLSEEIKENYKNVLLHFMADKKPYLNSSVSLNNLAAKTSIPPHHLSQVINTCFNQNFFDFVNNYRISESKILLSEKESLKRTVLEVLYETGFNSKSVFNAAFKKHTGMTPSQFRKLQNSRD